MLYIFIGVFIIVSALILGRAYNPEAGILKNIWGVLIFNLFALLGVTVMIILMLSLATAFLLAIAWVYFIPAAIYFFFIG